MRVKPRRRLKPCAVSVGMSTLPASSTSTTTRPEAARIASVTNAALPRVRQRWGRDGRLWSPGARSRSRAENRMPDCVAATGNSPAGSIGRPRTRIGRAQGSAGAAAAAIPPPWPSHRSMVPSGQEAECCVDSRRGRRCVQKRSASRIAQKRSTGCDEPGRKATPAPFGGYQHHRDPSESITVGKRRRSCYQPVRQSRIRALFHT